MRALAAGLALMAAGSVMAQEAPDPAASARDPEQRARELYDEGKLAYAEGRYEDAIRHFEAAFDLSSRPLLLYNLSLAYERVGDYDRALERLRGYSAAAPPDEREIVRKRIENLRRRIEAQRATPEPEAPKAEPAPAAPSSSLEPTPAPTATALAPEQRSALPAYLTLGAGGVLLGSAALLGGLALAAQGEVDGLCTGYQDRRLCRSEAREPMARRQNLAIAADVTLGLGLAAAGAGLFLWLFADSETAEPASGTAVSFTPWIGVGTAGLTGSY